MAHIGDGLIAPYVSIVGAGKGGNFGFPDIAAEDYGSLTHIWEVKYGSPPNRLLGIADMIRYTIYPLRDGTFAVPGGVPLAPFSLESATGQLMVYEDPTARGLILYRENQEQRMLLIRVLLTNACRTQTPNQMIDVPVSQTIVTGPWGTVKHTNTVAIPVMLNSECTKLTYGG